MEPVTILAALMLFMWGIAIWATFGEESHDDTRQDQTQPPEDAKDPRADKKEAA